MATSEVPPSRTSILASGQVKPIGPHQVALLVLDRHLGFPFLDPWR
jgi:hypothetical protein